MRSLSAYSLTLTSQNKKNEHEFFQIKERNFGKIVMDKRFDSVDFQFQPLDVYTSYSIDREVACPYKFEYCAKKYTNLKDKVLKGDLGILINKQTDSPEPVCPIFHLKIKFSYELRDYAANIITFQLICSNYTIFFYRNKILYLLL